MLREMIKRHEGYSNKPYSCPAGKKTIGYGHNIDANILPSDISAYLKENGKITPEMADALLDIDIKMADASCHRIFPKFDEFSENRRTALTDFLFNVGERTARTFKNTISLINQGLWEAASRNMEKSLWFDQVGNRSREIVGMIKEG